MNPKDFDDILKGKLKNLDSLDHAQSDWDRMERAIDEDSVKDQVFDEQVKRKLSQISIPTFVASNWDNLYELISLRIQRKRSVLYSKAFELAIIFLLFITSINLGIWEQDRTPVQYALQEFSQAIDIDNVQIAHARQTEDIIHNSGNAAVQSNNNSNIIADNSIMSKENNSENSIVTTKQLIAPLEIKKQSVIATLIQPTESLAISAATNNTAQSIDSDKQIEVHSIIASNTIHDLEFDSQLQTTLPPIQRVSAYKKPRWFVAASMNINTNFIKSGFKESFARTRNPDNVNPLEKPVNSTNYSIQAEMGYKKNKFAVSTGFEYQQIEYSPSIELTTGSLSTKLLETNVQSIKYDFFSIPLNISYDLLAAKGWAFGINAGVSMNALARSDQSIDQRIIRGNRTIEVAPKEIDASVLNYSFQEGIFDQPSVSTTKIWNSLFYRAKVGLGLQKNIGKNTSIFTQASYNFQLPAFQKESSDFEIDDNIQSISVGFGVRQFFG